MRRILVESSYASIWRDILEGITFFIRERHRPWELHCLTTAEFLRALAQRPYGALCVIQADQTALVKAIRQSRVPVVNMLRDNHPQIPSVLSDHRAFGVMAADYFLGRGFEHLAFLGPDRDWSNHRKEGFRQRLHAAGKKLLAADPHLSVAQYRPLTEPRARRSLQHLLAALPKPLALFAGADFIARTSLEICRDLSLRVPEDVAILGVDNDVAICELAPVSLSSIPQNLHRIGFEAARLLDNLCQRGARPRKAILVPPKSLVVRRSTDVFAFEDPRIALAMRLIHARPAESVTLQSLLKEAGISRQWLDRRFKEVVGRSVSQEIRRVKIDRVRSLLLETHLPIRQIAARCGFGQSENLTRFFRASVGMSPREFRMQHELVR